MAVTTRIGVPRRGRRRARATALLLAGALSTASAATLATGASPAGALSPVQGPGAWVNKAYEDILGRAPTPSQYQHRVGQLEAGTSRRAIADSLFPAKEWAENAFNALYDRIPGIDPGAPTYHYWTERLRAGDRVTTVASFLYGSPGTYAALGGTPDAFVRFLYRDILGREADAAGLAYWSGRVAAGENRTGLARAWLLTPEATELRAGVFFLEVLNRPPSAAERTDWGGRLRRYDERRIVAALVSSSEAYTLSQQHRPGTRLTAGNGHSRQPSISADGRIIAFASTATNLTPGGSPAGEDIFVIDRLTGRTRAITRGNGGSSAPEVSADGSTVVFQSAASDLVAGDANGQVDVFQAPTAGGAITRLTNGNGASTEPTVSADGTIVAFSSVASDLVLSDPNGAVGDVFVRDATAVQPAFERIGSAEATTRPTISADGGTVVVAVEDLPDVDAPGTMLYRLPTGAEPEPLVLGLGLRARPGISADGARAVYLSYAELGGRPFAELWLADIDGEEVTRTKLAGPYRIESSRISDDGTTVLATMLDESGHGDRVIRPDGPADPDRPTLPIGCDLSADGRLVVGSTSGQIVLWDA